MDAGPRHVLALVEFGSDDVGRYARMLQGSRIVPAADPVIEVSVDPADDGRHFIPRHRFVDQPMRAIRFRHHKTNLVALGVVTHVLELVDHIADAAPGIENAGNRAAHLRRRETVRRPADGSFQMHFRRSAATHSGQDIRIGATAAAVIEPCDLGIG